MTDTFYPHHLLVNELDYELAIRNVVTSRTVNEKRKILHRLLAREARPGDSIDLANYNFDFNNERDAINETLQSVTTVVIDFEGTASDSAFARTLSRLNHVTKRIQRIPAPVDDDLKAIVDEFKSESRATCLHLEAELYDKLSPEADSRPSLDNRVSFASAVPVINVTPQVTPSRSIPISEWNVKFTGDKRFVYSFLERVSELARSRNVSDDELYTSAVEFFVGDAFIWFLSIKSSISCWNDLVYRLKHDFLPPNDEDELWEQIKRRKQKRNESITIFIAQLENLFRRLPRMPVESTKVRYIRQNLLPEYFNQLALYDINSVTELTVLCKKLEDAAYIKSKNHPVLSVSDLYEPSSSHSNQRKPFNNLKNQNKSFKKFSNKAKFSNDSNIESAPSTSVLPDNSNKVKKQVVCWNCNQPNHTYTNCLLKRRLFCFHCGKSDVKFPNCPDCSKNE